MEDDNATDDEGEEVVLEDQGFDIDGEEEELGSIDDEDFEENPELELTLPQDSSTELADEDNDEDEDIEEDDQSTDGYDEIAIPGVEEGDPETVNDEQNQGEGAGDTGENIDPETEGDLQDDELAIGDNDISAASEFFVGYKKKDKLTISFRKKATKLYVKVKDESVCSYERGPLTGKKGVIYITGKKAGNQS